MKRNTTRTGPGTHCTHRHLGRGGRGTCSYGRRSYQGSSRPLVSIMSSLLGGMLDLADRSIRKLSVSLNNSNLLGDGSRKSGPSLPDLKLGREELSRLQDRNKKLPEDHEESHLIADKQK